MEQNNNEDPSGTEPPGTSSWNGFKIVGDNLDKYVKPRFMRINKQSQSLNYFNSYAVKDRIDLTSFSNFKPFIDIDVNVADLLPSSDVHSQVVKNMAVLVARILVDNMAVFKFYFGDVVERHILHKYSDEMSKKSEVVRF